MKKVLLNIIIVILVITSILGVRSVYQKNEQQKQINELFIASLVEARVALSIDYVNADESTRTAHSTRISSNLYSAVRVLNLSSYNNNKNRNQLFSAIYNLYLCMTNPDTKLIILTEKLADVHSYLTRIIEDINDTEAYEELSSLAGRLYFK
jgi:hypothetical protein